MQFKEITEYNKYNPSTDYNAYRWHKETNNHSRSRLHQQLRLQFNNPVGNTQTRLDVRFHFSDNKAEAGHQHFNL